MLERIGIWSSRAAGRLGLKAALCRFRHRQDGAATVEFALVAVPFLALLFAIIETALVFFASQVLETAVADSARLILTGQAQTQGLDQTKFKDEVCSRIYGLFDCQNGLYVDVKSYPSFSNLDMSMPIDPKTGKLVDNFNYSAGGPGSIVVVRLYYQWPLYVSLLGFDQSLANMGTNTRLLVATAAFRNEPYTN